MSRTKSSFNYHNPSPSVNINDIDPYMHVDYNLMMNDVQSQLFFDQNLSHEHLMFLLNNPNTIENEFIRFLEARIDHLVIPDAIRDRIIENLHEFGTSFTQINPYSNINHQYHVNYDSEEDSYADQMTDDNYSDVDDNNSDDLENQILDEIEMEQDTDGLSD